MIKRAFIRALGLLLLLTQHVESSYGEVDGVFGQTDSGDPWYVVTDANQDVLVHIARIDGQFVVHDAAIDMFHQVGSLWSALRQVLASGAPEEPAGVVVAFNPASREAQSFLSLVIAVFLAGQGVIQNFDAYKEVSTLEAVHYREPKLGADGQPVVVNGKEVWEKKSFTIYGASVYICPPIPFSELQGSPREAIEKVRLSIEAGLKKITPAGLAS